MTRYQAARANRTDALEAIATALTDLADHGQIDPHTIADGLRWLDEADLTTAAYQRIADAHRETLARLG